MIRRFFNTGKAGKGHSSLDASHYIGDPDKTQLYLRNNQGLDVGNIVLDKVQLAALMAFGGVKEPWAGVQRWVDMRGV